MATVDLRQRTAKYQVSTSENTRASTTRTHAFNGAMATKQKGSALAANDLFQLFDIPAGAFVETVTHKVKTLEGGTCTYSIGDVSDDNGFVDAANGNASTDASSFNGTTTPAFGVGKYYPTGGTLYLKLASGTAANLVVEVSASFILT
jgi:hypothetical protein